MVLGQISPYQKNKNIQWNEMLLVQCYIYLEQQFFKKWHGPINVLTNFC